MLKAIKGSIFGLIALFILMSSCTPQKKLVYFQDEPGDSTVYYPVNDFVLKLEKKDIITIQLYTVNPEAVPGLATTMDERVVDNRTFLEKGFVIDEDGELDLPLLGKVHLAGLSVKAATDTIQNRYRKIIEEPLVVLKKLSFKFTILGEVLKPGLYYVNNEQMTFAEALGTAGDLTYYGSRTDIKVFRRYNGKIEEFVVDLTKKDVVTTDRMYVHPDDVIYVRAFKRKAVANTLQATQVFTSIISTVMLVATFFLIKNNK